MPKEIKKLSALEASKIKQALGIQLQRERQGGPKLANDESAQWLAGPSDEILRRRGLTFAQLKEEFKSRTLGLDTPDKEAEIRRDSAKIRKKLAKIGIQIEEDRLVIPVLDDTHEIATETAVIYNDLITLREVSESNVSSGKFSGEDQEKIDRQMESHRTDLSFLLGISTNTRDLTEKDLSQLGYSATPEEMASKLEEIIKGNEL